MFEVVVKYVVPLVLALTSMLLGIGVAWGIMRQQIADVRKKLEDTIIEFRSLIDRLWGVSAVITDLKITVGKLEERVKHNEEEIAELKTATSALLSKLDQIDSHVLKAVK